jgi:hypothetical protein
MHATRLVRTVLEDQPLSLSLGEGQLFNDVRNIINNLENMIFDDFENYVMKITAAVVKYHLINDLKLDSSTTVTDTGHQRVTLISEQKLNQSRYALFPSAPKKEELADIEEAIVEKVKQDSIPTSELFKQFQEEEELKLKRSRKK